MGIARLVGIAAALTVFVAVSVLVLGYTCLQTAIFLVAIRLLPSRIGRAAALVGVSLLTLRLMGVLGYAWPEATIFLTGVMVSHLPEELLARKTTGMALFLGVSYLVLSCMLGQAKAAAFIVAIVVTSVTVNTVVGGL